MTELSTSDTPVASGAPTAPTTRKPAPLWDRVKFLLLAWGLFIFFVWSEMAAVPILSFEDSLDRVLQAK